MTSASEQTHPIEFRGVTKRYGSRTVLDDLTFQVPENSVVGLLGPNGAGKSTAMRVLLGLQHPDAGTATVFGRAAGQPGFREAVRQVGAIIESPPLYKNASPAHNLAIRQRALGLPVDEKRISSMLEQVGLAERSDDPVGKFSLGMRQRVGLAVALIGEPRIAVLDEPTNGLDPEGSVEVREMVKALPKSGTTVLICTHRLDEIEKTCDYVVVLQAGRLVTEGSLADITAMAGARGHLIEVAPDAVTHAAQVLASLGVGEVRVTDPQNGLIQTEQRLEDPGRITYALAMQGIWVRGLQTSHASLEDAFLRITGAVA